MYTHGDGELDDPLADMAPDSPLGATVPDAFDQEARLIESQESPEVAPVVVVWVVADVFRSIIRGSAR